MSGCSLLFGGVKHYVRTRLRARVEKRHFAPVSDNVVTREDREVSGMVLLIAADSPPIQLFELGRRLAQWHQHRHA